MQFVDSVRRFEVQGTDDPVEKAIDYCISNHILEMFLRDNRAEVLRAMTLDMTFERREELIREEEQAKTEEERKRAEMEKARADKEQARADKEQARADEAVKRAEAAEKLLAEHGITQN